MSEPLTVPLDTIPAAFEGLIPSAICTVDPDGSPNVIYLSVIHRIDDNHVALSRQFFNKTDRNTAVEPRAQLAVVEPESGRTYLLDLVYERTERDGPLFERVRTRLDAVAAWEGMANVFVLKGIDVCRVVRCEPAASVPVTSALHRSVNLEKVEAFSARVARATDMEELLWVTLNACEELLDYRHAFVMLADETGDLLYTVASNGYTSSGTGSEVRIGEGMIGLAAARRQSIRITQMARELSYSHAIRSASEGDHSRRLEQVIPLPGLASVRSQLVTPMLAYHQLVGVLCFQSEEAGAFQAADECIVSILANQVAMAMSALRPAERSPASSLALSTPVEATVAAPAAQVKHYAEDGSVFIDNEYLIKGVAGGILWRLLHEYQDHGRVEFSNKEIRLDQSLALPDIKDNLEARLVLLRKRLEERCEWLRIEKTGRGRFKLVVSRPLSLVQVQGGGPL
ncbi:hypothetical protein AYO38_03595 [bacterium SCGC AG-212-C10]|nr:hypothetical protein AYO38_03595 [bacterium SCGC AG-212-C10]